MDASDTELRNLQSRLNSLHRMLWFSESVKHEILYSTLSLKPNCTFISLEQSLSEADQLMATTPLSTLKYSLLIASLLSYTISSTLLRTRLISFLLSLKFTPNSRNQLSTLFLTLLEIFVRPTLTLPP